MSTVQEAEHQAVGLSDLSDDDHAALLEEAIESTMAKTAAYTPLDESDEIKLNPELVRKYLAQPTKSGKRPSDEDCIKFIMLCKARKLNPFTQDAYMLGYDTKDGPKFELITSHQALLKRATKSGQFDGMESGVLVKPKKGGGVVEELIGDFYDDDDHKLVGGWSKVYRKDQKIITHERVKRKVFDTGRSRWAKDPGGMIVKCAEASALRRAFPNEVGGMYSAEEIDSVVQTNTQQSGVASVSDQMPVGAESLRHQIRSATAESQLTAASQALEHAVGQDGIDGTDADELRAQIDNQKSMIGGQEKPGEANEEPPFDVAEDPETSYVESTFGFEVHSSAYNFEMEIVDAKSKRKLSGITKRVQEAAAEGLINEGQSKMLQAFALKRSQDV